MYYDLHIHSALSPCSDDTMTVNNIVNMAYIKGLDLIAITDHNSMRQLKTLEIITHGKIVDGKIDYLYGVEIQTKEEIHVLGYFQKDADLDGIQAWLDAHLIREKNDEEYYGHEYIFNESDEIIDHEEDLLLQSLDLSIYEVIQGIHAFHGIAVLAHCMAKKFGCYSYFHDIPADLDFDALEVTKPLEIRDVCDLHPEYEDVLFLIDSDAHQLEDISEPTHSIEKRDLERLWRQRCKK